MCVLHCRVTQHVGAQARLQASDLNQPVVSARCVVVEPFPCAAARDLSGTPLEIRVGLLTVWFTIPQPVDERIQLHVIYDR